MKKFKKFLVIFIFLFILAILEGTNVKAESYLHLNDLKFNVQINDNASINVTEYWDIEIEETNTLYKTFIIDNVKNIYITDVKVTDITKEIKPFFQQDKWEYHVGKGKYYGTKNEQNNFEIGWGVGLDNKYDSRKYKIEYKVNNIITKYNDYAELYWQAIGNDFEISADTVTGTILLPQNAKSIEDIKVWGHIETLNGTIYAKELNKIEFEVNGYNSDNMLEIRTLFPTEMIVSAVNTQEVDILETVIEEETKWAEAANRRRESIKNTVTTIIVIIGIIFDIIFIITITKANKNPIRKQKRFVVEEKMEYYRDIPRENATPGEAVNLLQKNTTDLLQYDNLGNIFSAVLLNLKVKGYLEFQIDENKKDNEKVLISISEKTDQTELYGEEKIIYAFLKQVISVKDSQTLTLKELEKVIKLNSEEIGKIGKRVGKNIYTRLIKENLLDKEQAKAQDNTKTVVWLQIIFLVMYLIFILAMVYGEGIGFNVRIIATMIITSVLGLVSIGKKVSVLKRVNPFTQQGLNEREKWKGLKKYMEDFSLLNEREVTDIEIWEKFLVYATVFGISEKVIKQLKVVYPNFEQLNGNDYTMMYIMMNTNFNRSFTSSVTSSISSTYSSATGRGGGFSGGGGGGACRRRRRRTLTPKRKK